MQDDWTPRAGQVLRASDLEEQISASPAAVTDQVTRVSDDIFIDCGNTADAISQWPGCGGTTSEAMDGQCDYE